MNSASRLAFFVIMASIIFASPIITVGAQQKSGTSVVATPSETTKKIEALRKNFEQQLKETEDLFARARETANNSRKSILSAEKQVDDLLARVTKVIEQSGDSGEFMKTIDEFINSSIEGLASAKAMNNEKLIKTFEQQENRGKALRKQLQESQQTAYVTLNQLRSEKDALALWAKAQKIDEAYNSLQDALNKFQSMVDAGKRLLDAATSAAAVPGS